MSEEKKVKKPKPVKCQTVEPIRDLDQLEKMKQYLYIKSRRDYCLFVVGINSGLRVSDLLKLKVEEVKNADFINIHEKKTGKLKQFNLSDASKVAIVDWLEYSGLESGILFPSKKGRGEKAVGREQIWLILKEAAKYAGVKENVGSHTMRKVFGYWAIKKGVPITYVMECLNHSSTAITRRYCGITQDVLNEKVYNNMNL